jgi:hypothetical protein
MEPEAAGKMGCIGATGGVGTLSSGISVDSSDGDTWERMWEEPARKMP